MSIPRIYIQRNPIRKIDVPDLTNWLTAPTPSFFNQSPVTTQIGFPIVDIPGCVKSNKEKNPKNTALLNDDPRGTLTLCDGKIPSYDPIEFNVGDYLQTPETSVPAIESPKNDFKIPSDEIYNITKPQVPQVKSEEN